MATTLDELSLFVDGWHYGEGKKISEKVIRKVRMMVEILGSYECNLELFPTLDGSVLIILFQDGEKKLEIEIGDKSFDISRPISEQ